MYVYSVYNYIYVYSVYSYTWTLWDWQAEEDPALTRFFAWDRLADFANFGGVRLEAPDCQSWEAWVAVKEFKLPQYGYIVNNMVSE